MRFVSSTGYLPVTKEAFENNIKQEITAARTQNLKKLLEAAAHMYREYTFLVPPNHEHFDRLSNEYEIKLKRIMLEGRKSVLKEHKALSVVSEELYQDLINP